MRSMARRRRHRLRGFGVLRRLGPGLVTGAADDDPSGIGTYSQVGATLRFDLLWTAVLSLPLAAAVIELASRLGLVRDRGLAAVVRDRFPRAVYPVLWLVVAANTFNIGADLGSMGASLRLVLPVPHYLGVVVFAVAIAVLEVRVPYARYARLLRWLVLSLAAYVGVLVMVHVPWTEVLRRTFVPGMVVDRAHLAALIAVFGTTISPYLFFWQAAEEVEAQGEAPETVTPGEMRTMRIDVIAGVTAGVIVMFAIMTATAVTLGDHPAAIKTADQAARALEPVAGSHASLLFALGILGTGFLAVPTLAGSSAYALSETFHWREGLSRSLREAPGFYAIIGGGMAVGAALNFMGVDPIHALFLSAVLNGLAAPPIIALMFVVSRADALGRWRSGRLSLTLVGAAGLVMTILPLWYLRA
jgi:NRAMP (natural resistance-associated macrophage protein)-like metal ion transporter